MEGGGRPIWNDHKILNAICRPFGVLIQATKEAELQLHGGAKRLQFPHQHVEPEAFCAYWKIWLLHLLWEILSGVSQDPNFGALDILMVCNKINVEIVLLH